MQTGREYGLSLKIGRDQTQTYSSNVKTFEIGSRNSIDHLMTQGSEIDLRNLVIYIKVEDSDRFLVTITRN